MKIKDFIKENRTLLTAYIFINNYLRNTKRGRGLVVDAKNAYLRNSRFISTGNCNRVEIGKNTRLTNCTIRIMGRCNNIIIGENCIFDSMRIHIEDDYNSITIGSGTTIGHDTEIACIEGCKVTIGADCMISSEVRIVTGDSHSIVDCSGKRLNPSCDVQINDHVWLGHRVTVQKGCTIANNCVVGAGAIVTHEFDVGNCILAGIPAKIVRKDCDWKRERI